MTKNPIERPHGDPEGSRGERQGFCLALWRKQALMDQRDQMSADTRQRRQEPAYALDLPEVYSATELAHASGVRPWVVAELIACAEIPTVDGEHVAFSDASEAVLAIKTGRLRAHPAGARPGVFGSALVDRRMRHSTSSPARRCAKSSSSAPDKPA